MKEQASLFCETQMIQKWIINHHEERKFSFHSSPEHGRYEAKCLLRYLNRVCGIKSVGRSITQLPCAGSLHNPWQLQWLVATLFAFPHLLQPYSLYLCADQGF
jgi:hypothetical protein